MNLNKLGFQKKITLSLVTVSLVGMIISGAVSYYFLEKMTKQQIDEALQSQIDSVQLALQISIDSAVSRQNNSMDHWGPVVLKHVSVNSQSTTKWTVTNQVDQSNVEVEFPNFVVDGKNVDDFKFVDQLSVDSENAATLMAFTPQGLVRVTTSLKKKDGTRAIKTLIPNSSAVYKSIAEGKRYSGLAPVLGKTYVTAYEPIFQGSKVVGALFLGTPEVAIEKIKDDLRQRKILDSGYFYILDSSGQLVLHPTKEGENLMASTDLDGHSVFKDMIHQKNGIIYYRWMNDQTKSPQNKLAIFKTFSELGWTVAASLNQSEAFAPLYKLQNIMIAIISSLTVLMGVVSYLLGRPMSKQLIDVEHKISGSVQENNSDSKSVHDVSLELAGAVTQQAAALQQTVSAVEEIRATVQANLGSTEGASKASQSLAVASNQGQESLATLSQAIDKISASNTNVSNQVSASYEEIGKILKLISDIEQKTAVINEIVFQTKLLSFNASVEAARAGESGKGFAVVAEEIGRLASLSGRSAVEIQDTLTENSEAVKKIIETAKSQVRVLLETSEASVSEGVQITQECQEYFLKMKSEVENINQLIAGITASSKEQATGINEISKAIVEIDSATQQSSILANNASGLSESLQQSSLSLAEAAKKLEVFIQGRSLEDSDFIEAASVSQNVIQLRHQRKRKGA